MPIGDVLPLVLLVVGAVVAIGAALVAPRRHQGRVGVAVALATVAAAGAATARLAATRAPGLTFSGTWVHDGLTSAGTAAILVTTGAVCALSPGWMGTDPRHGEWYGVLLLGAAGATVLVGAADLSLLVVGTLLASVTGYTLASWHRADPAGAEAGIKYFFIGALANPLLFLGAVFLYGLAGSTGYAALAAELAAASPPALFVGAALVFVGVAFELGAVPAHPWVPDVAEASPAPAAAFLTVAPKLGALVALARVLSVLPEAAAPWPLLVAAMAAATMTLGNLAALAQRDLRRLLGWASVAQAGYGLLAIAALGRSSVATPALLLFLFAYAAGNLAGFGVVVALRGRSREADYEGLARRRPVLAAALAVALLSGFGLPPLAGFAMKVALFGAAVDAGLGWLALLAAVNTAISMAYYLRFVGPLLAAPEGPPRVALLGAGSGLTAVLAAALTVAVGLDAERIVGTSLPVHPIEDLGERLGEPPG
jgi:NADH-quinone oxidoreductase subunit N